ncbi:MAG: thioredoxin [Bacteroidales bacterium]|nr:thioredoxin [Bacteroidales bacterium]
MAQAITDSNFDELVLNTDKPVVIDFWAEWCGPCRMIAPIIEELPKEYADKAIIAKCDVDENSQIASKFSIRNIPTLLFLKNGVQVDKLVGAVPKDKIVEKLNALL